MDDLTSAMIRGADALRRDHTFPSMRASELLMGAASARGLGDRNTPLNLAVASSRQMMNCNAFSSGGSAFVTYRTRYTAAHTLRRIRLRYSNVTFGIGSTGSDMRERDGIEAYAIKAAVEFNGATIPVTFGGDRNATIPVGEAVWSDWLTLPSPIPGGAVFYVRSGNQGFATGGSPAYTRWPTKIALQTGIGEGFATGDTVDALSVPGNGANGAGPDAIVSDAAVGVPGTLVLFGSSSTFGQGETAPDGGASDFATGYLARWAAERGAGFIRIARAGASIVHALDDAQGGFSRRARLLREINPRWIVQQMGGNDMTGGADLATCRARITALAGLLREAAPNAAIIQHSYTPVTTSTDTWATAANQTVAPSNDVRRQINNDLRTGGVLANVFDGVLDPFWTVEVEATGKWKTPQDGFASALTADGTHLTTLGHQTLQNALRGTVLP